MFTDDEWIDHKSRSLEAVRLILHGLFSDEEFEEWYDGSNTCPDDPVDDVASMFACAFEDTEDM